MEVTRSVEDEILSPQSLMPAGFRRRPLTPTAAGWKVVLLVLAACGGESKARHLANYPGIEMVDKVLEDAIRTRPRLTGGWVDRPEELLGMVIVTDAARWRDGDLEFSRAIPIDSYLLPSPQGEEPTPVRIELPKEDGLVLRRFCESGISANADSGPLAQITGSFAESATVEVFVSVSIGMRRQASAIERLRARASSLQPDQVLLWFPGFQVIKVRREGYAAQDGSASMAFGAFSCNGKTYARNEHRVMTAYLLPDPPVVMDRNSGFSNDNKWPAAYVNREFRR